MAKKTDYGKQITKINERMADIYRSYGENFSTYQSMKSYIKALQKQGIQAHISQNGYIAISQSEKGVKLTKEQINKLLEFKTRGQLEKTARKELKKLGVKNPTKEEIKKYTKMYSEFDKFIQEHRDEIYKDEKTMTILKNAGGSIDIDEMEDIINQYSKDITFEETHEVFENEKIVVRGSRNGKKSNMRKRKK